MDLVVTNLHGAASPLYVDVGIVGPPRRVMEGLGKVTRPELQHEMENVRRKSKSKISPETNLARVAACNLLIYRGDKMVDMERTKRRRYDRAVPSVDSAVHGGGGTFIPMLFSACGTMTADTARLVKLALKGKLKRDENEVQMDLIQSNNNAAAALSNWTFGRLSKVFVGALRNFYEYKKQEN